ncbi:MAG: ABC transporter ATP-binding protein [Actinomycetaceae bacterium]|nr:ABC transporter ATP-binding protein [Actinomycetaceae bacterium]
MHGDTLNPQSVSTTANDVSHRGDANDHTMHKSQPASTTDVLDISVSELIKPARTSMIITALLTAIGAICSIIPFIALTYMVYGFTEGKPMSYMWIWVIVASVALFAHGILYGAGLGLTHVAEANLRYSLRKELVGSFAKMPLGRIDTTSSGVIRKAVSDDTRDIHTLVAHLSGDFMNSFVTILAGATFLFVIDWQLMLAVLGEWIVIIVITRLFSGSLKDSFDDFSVSQSKLSAATVELVEGVKELKNFGGSDFTKSRFNHARTMLSDTSYQWLSAMGKPMSIVMAFLRPGVTLAALVPITLWFWNMGWSQTYQIVPFFLIAIGIPQGILTLVSMSQHLYAARQAAISTAQILGEPHIAEGNSPADTISNREIKFNDVTFGYHENRPVLSNISACMRTGTVTALVGPSGGGKSTLAKLVARFYDVTSGSITIGGHDVRSVSQQWLLSQVAIVFQDVQLIHDTVQANIAMGCPHASKEEIITAAKAASIHQRIMRLPHGYDTVIGDKDGILSGGEKQRLTLARAFLLDAPILILDEATAQSDARSEKQIHQALSTLCRGRTVIVIAHRLATVQDADNILVVADGGIEAQGTHRELLQSSSTYQQLWQRQMEGRYAE